MLRDVECRVLPSHSILGVGTTGRHHLVEGGYTIAGLKLVNILTHLMNNASNIVPLVQRSAHPKGNFPVLGVGAAHDDLDNDLLGPRLRDRRVDNLDLGP